MTSKKALPNDVENFFKGDSVFFSDQKESEKPDKETENNQPVNQSVSRSTNQPTSQPTKQLIASSANQSISPLTSLRVDKSVILGRPKSFYITDKQDKDLDVLVEKVGKRLEGKINQKIDRSTLIRLLLEISDLTSEETVSRLSIQLVSRLISQLTG